VVQGGSLFFSGGNPCGVAGPPFQGGLVGGNGPAGDGRNAYVALLPGMLLPRTLLPTPLRLSGTILPGTDRRGFREKRHIAAGNAISQPSISGSYVAAWFHQRRWHWLNLPAAAIVLTEIKILQPGQLPAREDGSRAGSPLAELRSR